MATADYKPFKIPKVPLGEYVPPRKVGEPYVMGYVDTPHGEVGVYGTKVETHFFMLVNGEKKLATDKPGKFRIDTLKKRAGQFAKEAVGT